MYAYYIINHVPASWRSSVVPARIFSAVHGWRIVETRGGAFPLVAVQFQAEWYITTVLHRYKPNVNVKTTITLLDICMKRCFIKFSFHIEGCFWQWEGALSCSGGARAPSKPLILRPWRSGIDHKRIARTLPTVRRKVMKCSKETTNTIR